jgi:capsular exopolysaccharide synthesis family protein
MSIGGSDPQTYLKLLWRWRLLFLTFLVGAPAIAYLVASSERKVYQSSALLQEGVLPVDTSLFTAEGASAPSATPNGETLSGQARVIETPPVAQLAAARLKPAPSDPRSLLGDITATPNTETGFITVAATGPTPQRAADIANAFAAAVVHLRTQHAIGLLTTVIDQVTAQLGALSRTDAVGRAQLSQQLQRLRALRAAQGANAQVLQTAVPSASPISPRVGRVVALGLLAGLLLGLGSVVVAAAADRRIRHPDDLEELTGLPLLAVIPRSAFSAETASEHEDEAFHMLRSALVFFNVDRPLSTILITSPLSGDGKTTVATRLSVAAARGGRDVIIVDADLRRPQVAPRLGIDGAVVRYGLAAVLTNQISLEEALVDVSLDEANGNDPITRKMQGRLRVLPGKGTPPNPSELLASDRMRELLKEIAGIADLVIIDSNPLLSVSDSLPLFDSVSGIVFVARLNGTTKDAVGRLQKTLANTGGNVLGVVATGAAGGLFGRYGYGSGYGYYGDTTSGNGNGRRGLTGHLRFSRKTKV